MKIPTPDEMAQKRVADNAPRIEELAARVLKSLEATQYVTIALKPYETGDVANEVCRMFKEKGWQAKTEHDPKEHETYLSVSPPPK